MLLAWAMVSARVTDRRFASVTSYMAWDHDRLDGVLTDVRRMVDDGRIQQARDTYRIFDQGLNRHIRIEEQVLFPLFENRTGMVTGPTTVLRFEHRQLMGGLALMRAGLERPDPARFREGFEEVMAVLPHHQLKEERTLYPTLDGYLAPDERAVLAARLADHD